MEVHSVRNYTDRDADHACFHNYPSVARLRVSPSKNNASMKRMKLSCVVPGLPTGPMHSQLWVGAAQDRTILQDYDGIRTHDPTDLRHSEALYGPLLCGGDL